MKRPTRDLRYSTASNSGVLRFVKRPSFVIGLLTMLCAQPVIERILTRYAASGALPVASLGELLVVPLIYFIVRCAERQMESEDRPVLRS